MILNSNFTSRLISSQAYQTPTQKYQVNDDVFSRVISISGPCNKFLDCSRCQNLSPQIFAVLSVAKSLLFLDLSYTTISDISSVSDNCPVLKSCLLSGVHLNNYSELSNLQSLEILGLRNSSLSSIDFLKNLIFLRSVDCGQTRISDLTPVVELTRLEELLIDCCPYLSGEIINQNLQVISSLPRLRLLNVAESGLEGLMGEVLDTRQTQIRLHGRAAGDIETKGPDYKADGREGEGLLSIELSSRREAFFRAVVNDDLTLIHSLLLQGQDVEEPLGPWGWELSAAIYNHYGCHPRLHLSAPFFLVDHSDPSLRPSALHLALYLSLPRVVSMLLFFGADLSSSRRCWFGSVHISDQGRVEKGLDHTQQPVIPTVTSRKTVLKSSLSLAQPPSSSGSASLSTQATSQPYEETLSALNLVESLCERGVHRVVLRMGDNPFILNWRFACSDIRDSLHDLLVQDKTQSNSNSSNSNSSKPFSTIKAEGPLPTEESGEKRKVGRKKLGIFPVTSVDWGLGPSLGEGRETGKWGEPRKRSLGESSGKGNPSEIDNAEDDEGDNEGDDEGDDEGDEDVSSSRLGAVELDGVGRPVGGWGWRDHPMVRKCQGTPFLARPGLVHSVPLEGAVGLVLRLPPLPQNPLSQDEEGEESGLGTSLSRPNTRSNRNNQTENTEGPQFFPVLGAREYKGDGVRWAMRDRERREEELLARERARWASMQPYERTHYKQRSLVHNPFQAPHPPYYQPRETLAQRRAEYLQLLEEEMDRRQLQQTLPVPHQPLPLSEEPSPSSSPRSTSPSLPPDP